MFYNLASYLWYRFHPDKKDNDPEEMARGAQLKIKQKSWNVDWLLSHILGPFKGYLCKPTQIDLLGFQV